uniref:Uncharacterized protein n=1 Tax=Falco tinnunculus TaxID=100819 RepID=A0A8C4V445_FALTI
MLPGKFRNSDFIICELLHLPVPPGLSVKLLKGEGMRKSLKRAKNLGTLKMNRKLVPNCKIIRSAVISEKLKYQSTFTVTILQELLAKEYIFLQWEQSFNGTTPAGTW